MKPLDEYSFSEFRSSADRLQILVVNRFREEQPDRELTCNEIRAIWFTIYGKLCRGETEHEVEKYCQAVTLPKKATHRNYERGYA